MAPGSWNPSSWKTSACLSCTVNTMAADGLVTQEAGSVDNKLALVYIMAWYDLTTSHYQTQCSHWHWNKNTIMLMKFSSLIAPEVVNMTTSDAASDADIFISVDFFFSSGDNELNFLSLLRCISSGGFSQPRIWCCHFLPPGLLHTLGASESLSYSRVSFELI